MQNKVIIKNELAEFFKEEAKKIAKEIPQKGYRIIVKAEPYCWHNVMYEVDDNDKIIYLKYYSVLRHRPYKDYYHYDLVKDLTRYLNGK